MTYEGASIKHRTEGGSKNRPILRTNSLTEVRTRGEGVQKSENFADVLNGSPHAGMWHTVACCKIRYEWTRLQENATIGHQFLDKVGDGS